MKTAKKPAVFKVRRGTAAHMKLVQIREKMRQDLVLLQSMKSRYFFDYEHADSASAKRGVALDKALEGAIQALTAMYKPEGK